MNPHPNRAAHGAALRVNPIWPMAALAAALLSSVGINVAIARTADGAQKTAVIALDAHASPRALDHGMPAAYTISLRNLGQADATGTRLIAALPVGIGAAHWTCAGAAGARCPRTAGNGAIDATITDLPAGGILLYTVDASVAAAPPPMVKNTIRAQLPNGATCADGQASPCTAHLNLPTGPRVDVSLTSNVVTPAASQALVYTLTVRNRGSVDAAGTVVRDPVPFGLVQFDWTCTGSAPCPHSSGQGSLHEVLAQFPPGSSLTYTITARTGAQPPPRIIHTATANPPYAGSCGEGSAIHAPPCVARAVSVFAASCGTSGHAACPATSAKSLAAGEAILSITQSTNGYAVSNPNFTYIVHVVNAASSPIGADGSVIDIPVPNGISSFDTWFCYRNEQPCSIASGTGALTQTLDTLQPGDDYTFTINVTKDPSLPSTITNTVTVTPAGSTPVLCAPGNTAPPCVSQLSLDAYSVAILSLTSYTDVGGASPGDTVQYVVSLNNGSGGASANGTVLSDPLPTGIASWSWTCASNGAECPALSGTGPLNETLPVFNAGTGLTYTIDAIVAQGAPTFIDNIATATVAPGVTAVCGTGGPSAPCNSYATVATVPVIRVNNNSDTQQATAGGNVTFLLEVRNNGAAISDVLQLDNPVPPGLQNMTWTCSTSSGQSQCEGGNAGSGPISQAITVLASQQTINYVINGTAATPAPNVITSVATVMPPPSGICEDPPGGLDRALASAPPCIAEASVYSTAILDVTKTAATTQLVPGGVATYTVTLNKAGLAINDVRLFDPVPPGIDNVDWTCTSQTQNVACPQLMGTGDLDQTFGPLLDDASFVYTLTALVSQTAVGSVTNTATVTAPSGAVCSGSCAATSTLPVAPVPAADLKITKVANVAAATPGSAIVYTVTVVNDGTAPAVSTVLSDPMPAGITAFTWTCASAALECPNPSGSGSIAETIPILTGQVQYTVTATVSPSVTQAITNTATLTPTSGVTCNQSLCSATVTIPVTQPSAAQIYVQKTANVTAATPNGVVNYTVTVSNSGDSAADTLTLVDPVPAGITAFTWTCSASGTSCPASSGQGALNEVIASLPGHTSLVYQVHAQIAATLSASIVNTATALPSDMSNCAGSSCTANVTLPVTITPPVQGPNVVVTNSSSVADGTPVLAGQPIRWTVTVSNDGAPTVAPLTLTDTLPTGIEAIRVTADPGVLCTPMQPAPGQSLVCTVAAGFTGSLQLVIDAVVSVDSTGTLSNSVTASGSDQPACNACSINNPITVATDVALGNPRPFSAAGINGYLFDLVNARGAVAVTLAASPASAVQLLGNYASGCTASDDGGDVVVSCPPPPPAQQLTCSGATCSIGTLAAGQTITVFVAANGSAALSIQASAIGDVVPDNDSLLIPPPSGAP